MFITDLFLNHGHFMLLALRQANWLGTEVGHQNLQVGRHSASSRMRIHLGSEKSSYRKLMQNRRSRNSMGGVLTVEEGGKF
jgi:hypothetical protein